jgi:hypothetical protein
MEVRIYYVAVICLQSLNLLTVTTLEFTAVQITVFVKKVLTFLLLCYISSHGDKNCEFICGPLSSSIIDSQVCGFILAGDFNFSPHSVRHDFLVNSLATHCAVLADECPLITDSFTYVSDCHHSTSC